MNSWEALFIQAYHQTGQLITEQQINDHNPLFELAQHKEFITQSTT